MSEERHEDHHRDVENKLNLNGKDDINGNTSISIEVPDGGYGWFILLGFILYNFSTWGANSGYAIYLAHYLENNTFAGGSKLDYASIGGLAFSCGLFFAPVITWLYHIFSIQFIIGLGILFQGAALLLAAFSVTLWEIYLTQGVLIGFGLAFIFIPSVTLIPLWFRNKRSLASGIGTAGSGLGGIVFNLGMQSILQKRGVKWALIAQCIICTSLSTIALMLTRTTHQGLRQHKRSYKFELLDYYVLSNFAVWLLFGFVSFAMLGYVVLLYSLSDFTVSLGYTSKQGTYVSCMVSVGSLLGRPIVGHIADKYGPLTVGMILHLVMAILCWAMWIPCKNLATAIAFGLLVGSIMGTIWPTIASIVTRIVGLQKLPGTFGSTWIFMAAFALVAPIIGLELRSTDTNGNDYYRTAIFVGFAYFGVSLCQWLLRGFIIARDEIAVREAYSADQNELHLNVKLSHMSKCLFRYKQLPRRV
ncbi:BDC_1c_G0031500.mRNA.1.CDS.1 [Saccharomyces cerevisiae]|nr:BDC_1c_G0031500.mRNA.1.CDS.1 [Saccharomyces cerevisiae]CAI7197651.1 BDC_1c_G0031500.mRNA.1.CDS.1 [Saccharomyces cerevisiae]